MNCPGHAVMYRSEKHSYRDLPIRFADFGRLHRAERSGTLHGLTRVRAMAQDDAHIFCTEEQIAAESRGICDGPRSLRRAGIRTIELKLGTMPEKHLGTEEDWRRAREARRRDDAQRFGFELNPGEGAFYGPKIEIYVPDALKRKWQVATIQLDFNMPERFGLEYTTSAGHEARPVMIHRAVLGTWSALSACCSSIPAGFCRSGWRPSRCACFRSAKKSRITPPKSRLLKREGYRAPSRRT